MGVHLRGLHVRESLRVALLGILLGILPEGLLRGVASFLLTLGEGALLWVLLLSLYHTNPVHLEDGWDNHA